MLSADQVRHIAKLARLGLSEKDIDKFAKQLSGILSYIEKLDEVKAGDVEPTAQVTGLRNVMRQDKVENEHLDEHGLNVVRRRCTREELLGCTQLPVEFDQIKVKPVITS